MLFYEVAIKPTGGAETLYSGITPSEYNVSGLTELTSYSYKVRSYDLTDGVIIRSPWSGWVNFSTTQDFSVKVTLGLINAPKTLYTITPDSGADVTKPVITLTNGSLVRHVLNTAFTAPSATASDNLDGNITGSIVVSGTVNTSVEGIYTLTYNVTDAAGNTAVPVECKVHVATPQAPLSYNVEYRLDANVATQVTGITQSQYSVTGLQNNGNYSFRVQSVGTYETSPWTSWQSFATLVGDPPIVASIGSISKTQTLYAVSTSIVQNVFASIGTITGSQTLYAVTGVLGTIQEVPAELWDIELRNRFTNTVTTINNVNVSQYTATLLTATEYDFRVRGKVGSTVTAYTDWSAPFSSSAPSVFLNTTSTQTTQALDVFYVTLDPFVMVTGDDVTDFYGYVSDNNSSVSVTFEGQTYTALVRDNIWLVQVLGNRMGTGVIDELVIPEGFVLSGDMQLSGNDGILLSI